MAARTAGEARHALKGGVIAGIIGGVAMSIFMMGMNAAKGQDIWMGAKMPALRFLGDRAMEPGFDAGPVLLGMISHFGVAIFEHVLFGLAVGLGFLRFQRARTLPTSSVGRQVPVTSS